jgi:hypothetical protein
MKNDRLQELELDRLDNELNRAEQAQLLQWETHDLRNAVSDTASEPSMRDWRPSLLARTFRWRCLSKLSGRR